MAKKAKKQKSYPFLFYGNQVGRWGEGPHCWLVRFVEPLSEETRGKLGEAAAQVLRDEPLIPDRFLFATDGPWAALQAEESDADLLPPAAALMLALHELAPIAEVILATALEPGYSYWDQWSHAKQSLPTEIHGVKPASGEELVRLDASSRNTEADGGYAARCEAVPLVPVAPSPAFDEAFTARRDALHAAALEEALEGASDGKPALIPVAPGTVRRPVLPAEQAALIGPHEAFAVAASGRVVAIVPGQTYHELAVLEPGGSEVRRIEVKHDIPTKYVSLSPAGSHVVFAAKRDLIELDLATGEQQVVFQLDGLTSFDGGYLDSHDRILAQWHDHVALLCRSPGGELEEVAGARVGGVGLVVLQGRYGFLSDSKAMRVVKVEGDTIVKLGTLPAPLKSRVFEAELDGEPGLFVMKNGHVHRIIGDRFTPFK